MYTTNVCTLRVSWYPQSNALIKLSLQRTIKLNNRTLNIGLAIRRIKHPEQMSQMSQFPYPINHLNNSLVNRGSVTLAHNPSSINHLLVNSGANICRGWCGIAIFCGFRDKSRFFKFPRWIAISVRFHHRFSTSNIENYRGTTAQRPTWSIVIKLYQTLQNLTQRYKTWPNVLRLDQKSTWPIVNTKLCQTFQNLDIN